MNGYICQGLQKTEAKLHQNSLKVPIKKSNEKAQ